MLWSVLLTAAILYGGVCLALYLGQGRLVFFPTRELVLTPADRGAVHEEVWIDTDNGERLHGWFLPVDKPLATVLFMHGNAGNISHRLDSLAVFRRLELQVLIFDYRGYGRSEGRPGEQATYRDAEAAWRYLVDERGLAPEGIVLFGRSLGGAVAAWLATQRPVAGLILESTFTSVPDLGAQLYPVFPVRRLARIRYPTVDRLANVRCPVLVVHSPNDELVPYSHGRRLFEAAPEPKHFLVLRGGHNDGFLMTGRRYQQGLAEFIALAAHHEPVPPAAQGALTTDPPPADESPRSRGLP